MHDPPVVLIVDDEALNLELLEQELETSSYDILTAASGEQALRLASERTPDAVLLDVLMPAMDGFEVCRRLRGEESLADVPVIFMTALSGLEDKIAAFEAGGVDFVTKPFQTEELLARLRTHLELRRARHALAEQNARLRAEIEAHQRARQTIDYLREEIRDAHNFDEIVGRSPALAGALRQVELVAATDATVLVLGETGTGKELVARAIHQRSPRNDRPLIKLNCAALPSELVESELFGHERGAFSGATQQRKGRFELADGGTLFLDEVVELSAGAQAKLLRVLAEQEFERVGGSASISVDVRVIAATNKALTEAVASGGFREDLFYRLNVFPIVMPPLRERAGDVEALARHFLDRAARRLGRRFEGIAPDTLAEMARYAWPGNVRELENVVERGAILSPGPDLELAEPLGSPSSGTGRRGTLEQVERTHILRTLEDAGWIVEGAGGAAARLDINPSTLRGRMRKLGIAKPR